MTDVIELEREILSVVTLPKGREWYALLEAVNIVAEETPERIEQILISDSLRDYLAERQAQYEQKIKAMVAALRSH